MHETPTSSLLVQFNLTTPCPLWLGSLVYSGFQSSSVQSKLHPAHVAWFVWSTSGFISKRTPLPLRNPLTPNTPMIMIIITPVFCVIVTVRYPTPFLGSFSLFLTSSSIQTTSSSRGLVRSIYIWPVRTCIRMPMAHPPAATSGLAWPVTAINLDVDVPCALWCWCASCTFMLMCLVHCDVDVPRALCRCWAPCTLTLMCLVSVLFFFRHCKWPCRPLGARKSTSLSPGLLTFVVGLFFYENCFRPASKFFVTTQMLLWNGLRPSFATRNQSHWLPLHRNVFKRTFTAFCEASRPSSDGLGP